MKEILVDVRGFRTDVDLIVSAFSLKGEHFSTSVHVLSDCDTNTKACLLGVLERMPSSGRPDQRECFHVAIPKSFSRKVSWT